MVAMSRSPSPLCSSGNRRRLPPTQLSFFAMVNRGFEWLSNFLRGGGPAPNRGRRLIPPVVHHPVVLWCGLAGVDRAALVPHTDSADAALGCRSSTVPS